MKKYHLLLLLLLFSASGVQAQESLQQLNSYMAELRAGNNRMVPESVLRDKERALVLLNGLTPYYTDTLERIRSEAYPLSRRIGTGHPRQEGKAAKENRLSTASRKAQIPNP